MLFVYVYDSIYEIRNLKRIYRTDEGVSTYIYLLGRGVLTSAKVHANDSLINDQVSILPRLGHQRSECRLGIGHSERFFFCVLTHIISFQS